MAYIFALLNQKGGIGKTTAAVQLSAGLRQKGYRVLAIDMDPQCNLSYSFASDYQNSPTIYDALLKKVNIKECIQKLDEVDLVPSNSILTSLESRIPEEGKEYVLKNAIKDVLDDYDYIVIDSPPALSLITVSIMTVTDSIIIPANLDMYSLQGIGQLYRTYQAVKSYCNPKLKIEGILITRNARVLKRMLYEVADNYKIGVFDTFIHSSPIVVTAAMKQSSLFKYAPEARVTNDYRDFIDELLHLKDPLIKTNRYEKEVKQVVTERPEIHLELEDFYKELNDIFRE